MKRALLFALSVVLLTVPLTWLWLAGGGALYADAVTPVAREIYDLLGIEGRGTMRRLRFINAVPFVALMALTPGLGWRRRLVGLGVGGLLLSLSHIALNGIAIATRARGQLPPVAALASDSMPFLLWFLFARSFVLETVASVRRSPDLARASQPEATGPGPGHDAAAPPVPSAAGAGNDENERKSEQES